MKEKKERTRKEYAKGGSAQKMMTFRLDNELADWLQTIANKGRLINELLRKERERCWTEAHRDCADMPREIEDTLT